MNPFWADFAAINETDDRHMPERVTGFALLLLACIITSACKADMRVIFILWIALVGYIFAADPFIAIEVIFSRAARVMITVTVGMVIVTVIIPTWQLAFLTLSFAALSFFLTFWFNARWKMHECVRTSKTTRELIDTSPKSEAGMAWQADGARTVNGIAFALGAISASQSESEARKAAYFAGYRQASAVTATAKRKMSEMEERCQDLSIQISMMKRQQARQGDEEEDRESIALTYQAMLSAQEAKYRQELDKLKREKEQILQANEELLQSVPEADHAEEDSRDRKLYYAYRTLGYGDSRAGQYAGVSKSTAQRWRKSRGIVPDTSSERERRQEEAV